MEEICAHPWKYYTPPFRVIGNVYYVGNTDVSSYLLDTGDGLILHDTGFPQTVYLLLESIRKLGFDPADIRLVLHSHAHYDHMGGTCALTSLTGSQTALGRDDLSILAERPELSWAPEYGVELYEGFTPGRLIDDGEVIRMGSTEIHCLHVPGHTPGAVSYFFEVEENGRCYRAATHGGPGLNTLSTEYLQRYHLPESRRDIFFQSLQKLKKKNVDVFLGIHPAQCRLLEKAAAAEKMPAAPTPFAVEGEWEAFLSGIEEEFRKEGMSSE
jgi:metallo-beta-lactamase class B